MVRLVALHFLNASLKAVISRCLSKICSFPWKICQKRKAREFKRLEGRKGEKFCLLLENQKLVYWVWKRWAFRRKCLIYTLLSCYCFKHTLYTAWVRCRTLAVSSQYWLSTSLSCSFIWSCAGCNAGMVGDISVKPLSHIPVGCLRKYSKAKIYQAFSVAGFLFGKH